MLITKTPGSEVRMYEALMEMDPPEGFERVSWEKVAQGEEVYLIAFDETATELRVKAVGPFRVCDSGRRTLLGRYQSKVITEPGERLLRKVVIA